MITLAESGSASAKVITTRMLEIKNAEVAAGRAGKSFDIFKSKTFYGFIGQVCKVFKHVCRFLWDGKMLLETLLVQLQNLILL